MQRLIAVLVISLVMIFDVQGMEIVGETKKLNNFSTNCGGMYSDYYETQKFLAHKTIDYNIPEQSVCRSFYNLPSDIQNSILNTMFELLGEKKEKYRRRMSLLKPALFLFQRTQMNGPLNLGNKTFEWKDVIVLKKKQQEDLVKLCNPDPYYSAWVGTSNGLFCRHLCSFKCCGCSDQDSDINLLKGMPAHIKKGLIVHVADDSVCCLYELTISLGTFLSAPFFCCMIQRSLPLFIAFMVAGGIGVCSFIGPRMYQKCHTKQYWLDLDVVEQ